MSLSPVGETSKCDVVYASRFQGNGSAKLPLFGDVPYDMHNSTRRHSINDDIEWA